MSWLEDCFETHALIGALLSVVQPELYEALLTSYRALKDNPTLVENDDLLQNALLFWNLPFNGVAVINNRLTPLHRDINGRNEWFDILLGLGEYTGGRFELPNVGLRCQYDPGCVLAFSGKLLRHGSDCEAQRACIAYFMRNNVQKRLISQVPLWDNISRFFLPSSLQMARDVEDLNTPLTC